MSGAWSTPAGWMLHTAVGGGSLLLLAAWLVRRTGQPARRQRLGEAAVGAALVLALLNLGPSWLTLTVPSSWAAPPAGPEPPSPAVPEAAAPPADAGRQRDEGPRSPDPARAEPQAPALDAALPLLVPDDGDLPLPEPPAAESVAARPRAAEAVVVPAPVPPAAAPPRETDAPAEATPPDRGFPADGLVNGLVGAYALGAGLVAGRWLLGYLALWWLLARCGPAPEPVGRVFQEMAAGLGVRPRLLASPRVRVPLSCGLWRPTVVLPAALCEPAPGPALRWVLAHELTHLERRDAWACLLFGLGQVVYFYLPWFWWLRRQVGLCQEYVADAAAADAGGGTADYAQFLLGWAGTPAVPAGATGVLGNSSDLFRRMTMLLQSPIAVERCCPRRWSLAAVAGLLALAVLVSGLGVSAGAAPAGPDRAAVVKIVDEKAPARKEEAKPPAGKKPGKQERGDKDDDAPAGPPDFDKLHQRMQEMMRSGASPEEVQKEMQKLLKELGVQFPPGGGGFPGDPEQVEQLRKAMEPLGGRPGLLGAGPQGGRLGIRFRKPSAALADQLDLPEDQGQVVEEVQPGSAAAKAGLKKNDILLELAGKPVSSDEREFLKMVGAIKADAAVDVTVLRKGKKETLKGLKVPEAKRPAGVGEFPPAAPPFPQPGGIGGGFPGGIGGGAVPGFPGGIGGFGGGQAILTTVVRSGDRITTRYQEGSLIISLTGSVTDGKAKINAIHVQDGRTTEKYESVEKVPERYRDKVKDLIEMSEKGNVKVEIRKP